MDETLDKDTQEVIQKKSNNSIVSIILSIVIIGMGIYGVKYGNFDGVSKSELERSYTQTSEISFNSLSSVQKNKYVSKDKYLEDIDKLESMPPKTIEKVVEKIVYKDKIVKSEPKEIIVEKIVETKAKEIIVEKIVYKDKIVVSNPRVIEKLIEKTVYKDKTIDRSKFDVFRCYGMSPSGYRLTSQCISGLKKFLKKNTDAKYFEVIAVMNPKDFRTIMILEQKTDLLEQLDLNKKQVSKLKDLSSVGLDKLRVVETIWEVKKILGKQTIVVPVSYNVNSNKYRGTVLRAYK